MKSLHEREAMPKCVWLWVLLATLLPLTAAAQAPASGLAYDKVAGEISPGTAAPTRERLVNAIKSATPTALYTMLEHGERVECFECIPLLADKLLSSGDAQVREIAAWWLRRRSFGFGAVMVRMQAVVQSDPDPVQRERAAQALGEFLDPHGLSSLADAAKSDKASSVRLAAVRALGRLDAMGGNDVLAEALSDPDASVRLSALEQVLKVNFFRNDAALIGKLADDDAQVRRAAAQLCGELGIADALLPLLGLLRTDLSPAVRQAAAYSLGQLGGAEASAALDAARKTEKSDGVLDAIDIAARMRVH